MITRDAECLKTLLYNVFVRQEIDTHTVAFTKESGSHATKDARDAGLLHNLSDAVKWTTDVMALLGLHSDTHMFDRSSHPAISNTA